MAEKNKEDALIVHKKNMARKILDITAPIEGQIVSLIYKHPDYMIDFELCLDDFHNNDWRVYFEIARGLIIDEQKDVITDIEVGLYLNKHQKLKEQYEKSGGYDTIEELMGYAEAENFESYVSQLHKWNAVIRMLQKGFPIDDAKLHDYEGMNADDIYDKFIVYLNDIFVNVDNKVKALNGFEGMRELVDALDEGMANGIPLTGCDVLNGEIGGLQGGSIYGFGAASGVGKSTLTINYIFPTMIEYDLHAVFIINEEDETKFKKEALIWYCNNKMETKTSKPITKRILRDGNFDEETKAALYEAADWFNRLKDRKNITIIPLERYTASTVIKYIKQYTKMGADVIVLDTLKESSDSRNGDIWKTMMNDCVSFYDEIKHTNTAFVVTYQLVKNRSRYLSSADIGMSKGILDVFSVNLLFRRPFDDEYDGSNGNRRLYAYHIDKHSQVQDTLEKGKHYMICFISKNRFGNSGKQVLSEADFSVNKYKDIGYCVVPQDF